MPRYLLEAEGVVSTEFAAAVLLADRRFPEVAVERRYTASNGDGPHTLCLCRAPSEAHLARWAEAARLHLRSVRRIESATNPPSRSPSDKETHP